MFKSETALKNVVFTPIIGDWAFNPINKKVDPQDFLTGPLLDRMHMCGVDVYQNRSGQAYDVRLGRIFDFLDKSGHSQMPVGVGETGCTTDLKGQDPVAWWKNSWAFAVKSGRVPAISYFNSQHNNNSGNTWLLWETSAKLAAFKGEPGLGQRDQALTVPSPTGPQHPPPRGAAARVSPAPGWGRSARARAPR